jgi:hypothetical protein
MLKMAELTRNSQDGFQFAVVKKIFIGVAPESVDFKIEGDHR